MTDTNTQSGFTIVELLITLFVAGIFLVAGFQLFNLVIKDGGKARADTRASNVAYDYMRRYSLSATNPCTALTPLTSTGTPISVSGLSSVIAYVSITCPYAALTNVSTVSVTILYNDPNQTIASPNPNPDLKMVYATYVTQ